MDIVDINKVLDDLELNEEQHSKLNGPKEDDNIYNNVYASTGPSINQHSTVQTAPSHFNRAAKKKFVNVSNVFNSLNEYVNAGIDTVKVTSEKTNLTSLPSEAQLYSTATTVPTATPATSTSTAITTNIQQSNQPSIESINVYETNDTTSRNDFGNNLSEENEEISTLHSSMTQTSEYSAINEQETNSVSNKLCTENSPTEEETPTERTEQTEQTEESTAPIQSDHGDQFIPQLTVSEIDAHEIENTQNDDNERAEEAQLEKTKEMEIEHEKRIESIDRPVPENDNINNQLGIASKSSDRFIKPISFETAATMDDVSDTELESYLQELEDLEESTNCDSNNHKPNDHILDNVDDVQLQIETQISNDEQSNNEKTSNKENTSGLNQNVSISKDYTITMSNVSDSNNSAATVTTVETTTDDNVGDSSTYHRNPANTIDNNQDLVKPPNELLNTESVPDNVEDEITKNTENSSPDCEEQLGLESDTNQIQMTNQSTFIPKRPNTLDLPSVINVSNDDTTDTPATGQLMTSSISSSNSDMSSQLTPINPTPESSNDNANSESPSHDATNVPTSPERSAAAAHLINSTNISINNIGKVQPYWIPDSMTMFCMLCNQKFSFIKRRHHCRACGLVLCSTCCSLKSKLEYLGDAEARICIQCDILLNENRELNRV